MRRIVGRAVATFTVLALALAAGAPATLAAKTSTPDCHRVIGKWVDTYRDESLDRTWVFRKDGTVTVKGSQPRAEGRWSAVRPGRSCPARKPGKGQLFKDQSKLDFNAVLRVPETGQRLVVLGTNSQDGLATWRSIIVIDPQTEDDAAVLGAGAEASPGPETDDEAEPPRLDSRIPRGVADGEWVTELTNKAVPTEAQALAADVTLASLSRKTPKALECYRPKLGKDAGLEPDKCSLNPATICEPSGTGLDGADRAITIGTLRVAKQSELFFTDTSGLFLRPDPNDGTFIDKAGSESAAAEGEPWDYGWDELVADAAAAGIELADDACGVVEVFGG